MTGCSAPNCSSQSSRSGLTFYRFPANLERREIWLINCGRKDWIPSQNARLCSKHFDESQIEQKRLDGKRRLKPFAVPTLFVVPDPPKMINLRKRRTAKATDKITTKDIVPNVIKRKYKRKSTIEFEFIDVKCEALDELQMNRIISPKQYSNLRIERQHTINEETRKQIGGHIVSKTVIKEESDAFSNKTTEERLINPKQNSNLRITQKHTVNEDTSNQIGGYFVPSTVIKVESDAFSNETTEDRVIYPKQNSNLRIAENHTLNGEIRSQTGDHFVSNIVIKEESNAFPNADIEYHNIKTEFISEYDVK